MEITRGLPENGHKKPQENTQDWFKYTSSDPLAVGDLDTEG